MTRQEAVEVIKEFVAYGEHVNAFVYKGSTAIPIEALNMSIKALEQEPKRGKWIDRASELDADFGRHDYVCSKCFKRATYYVGGSTDWWDRKQPNFCPNCGARMESDEE